MATGLVHPFADLLVADADTFNDRVVGDPPDHGAGPLVMSAVWSGGDAALVEPVGHLRIAGARLQTAKPLIVDRLGRWVLSNIGLTLGIRWLDVAVNFALKDSSLREAVAESPANAVGGVFVVGLMPHDGEEGAEPPVVPAGIDVIVQRDQAGAMIFAPFTEDVGMDSPDDPAEVLGEKEVILPGFDFLDGLEVLFAVQPLPTTSAGKNIHVVGQVGVILQPAAMESFLISQGLDILVVAADAAGGQDLEFPPMAGNEGRIEKSRHEDTCTPEVPRPKSIGTVCQSS
jgi:hypothetical protein